MIHPANYPGRRWHSKEICSPFLCLTDYRNFEAQKIKISQGISLLGKEKKIEALIPDRGKAP